MNGYNHNSKRNIDYVTVNKSELGSFDMTKYSKEKEDAIVLKSEVTSLSYNVIVKTKIKILFLDTGPIVYIDFTVTPNMNAIVKNILYLLKSLIYTFYNAILRLPEMNSFVQTNQRVKLPSMLTINNSCPLESRTIISFVKKIDLFKPMFDRLLNAE